MHGDFDSAQTASGPVVKVDGQVIPVPPDALQSMGTLIARIERWALGQHRVLSLIRVDGYTLPFPGAVKEVKSLKTIEVTTVSFNQRGREVLKRTTMQLEVLEKEIADYALLVLVNDLVVARHIWRDLVTSIRSVLFEMGLLQELCMVDHAAVMIAVKSLADHINDVGALQAKAEMFLRTSEGIVGFSDLLERDLMEWVQGLGWFVRRIPDYCLMKN